MDAMEQVILQLLARRGEGKTICPSEAARASVASRGRSAWEVLMPSARHVAFELAAAGKIEITQKGKVVEGPTARGPIRLRLKPG